MPTTRRVVESQTPEPEDPGSVTPDVQETFQWLLMPSEPMQLSVVVRGLLEKLMDFSSTLG
jgi:hypothetical protein